MIIAKIHNVYKTLTLTEQRIASFILKFPHKIPDMKINELADACSAAPSAVNRMCKSIGVDGFSKLKLMLASSGAQMRVQNDSVGYNNQDSCEMVFSKVFDSGVNALKNTLNMLDFDKAHTIADKISKANHVYIFGVGTSSVVANDAAYRFSQLGVHAYAYTDILQMSVMAKNMKKGDIAFAVSHSGTTKAVVDAMRFAKESGAETVALTSFEKSLIYTESDYAISVYSDEENYPVEAVSARISHMCVIDGLMLTIASLSDDYENHISQRNTVLDYIRY